MSNNQQDLIEYLNNTTAHEFLVTTPTDGQLFTSKIVLRFLWLKYGDEALKDGMLTMEQSKAMTKVDKALDRLFATFKDGYFDNVVTKVI
jgi:hypothetical protein